jgi:hypothetical protein
LAVIARGKYRALLWLLLNERHDLFWQDINFADDSLILVVATVRPVVLLKVLIPVELLLLIAMELLLVTTKPLIVVKVLILKILMLIELVLRGRLMKVVLLLRPRVGVLITVRWRQGLQLTHLGTSLLLRRLLKPLLLEWLLLEALLRPLLKTWLPRRKVGACLWSVLWR